jgi:hypothetical protein
MSPLSPSAYAPGPARPRMSKVTPVTASAAANTSSTVRSTQSALSSTAAVPYATISLIVWPISAESNRIITTAFACLSFAFFTRRSTAWRRASSSSCVYSLISPHKRTQPRHDVAAEAAASHNDTKYLTLDLVHPVTRNVLGCDDQHEYPQSAHRVPLPVLILAPRPRWLHGGCRGADVSVPAQRLC